MGEKRKEKGNTTEILLKKQENKKKINTLTNKQEKKRGQRDKRIFMFDNT